MSRYAKTITVGCIIMMMIAGAFIFGTQLSTPAQGFGFNTHSIKVEYTSSEGSIYYVDGVYFLVVRTNNGVAIAKIR
jgi:hypothetical protein